VELSTVWTAGLASAIAGTSGDGLEAELRPVLVVAGTLTNVEVPDLLRCHAALPAGTPVLAFGACTISGGPYWDSYSVTNGVDQVLPVALHVPGCPPTPETFLAAVRRLGVGAAPRESGT
jgi:NADH-quinone oxidoreductase subunit B